jgi:hypothetical protein
MGRPRSKFAAHRHPLYRAWESMLRRCRSKGIDSYRYYGARGITVCDRWMKFENFLADMGERPAGMSLERKDNNGPYSPENCVWATPKQQSANTRNVRLITFNGETHPISEWARRIGISHTSLMHRLKTWPLEEALTQPADEHRVRKFEGKC